MENNEKLDIIKEELNKNTEEMPLSLSRENMMSSLENIGRRDNIKHFSLKRWVCVAASFAVVLLSVLALKLSGSFESKSTPPQSNLSEPVSPVNDGQAPCEPSADNVGNSYDIGDYSDIIEYFKSKREEIKLPEVTAAIMEINGVDNSLQVPASPEFSAADTSESYTYKGEGETGSSLSYGNTNTQVSGVDEADIIKNDGTYLYILRSSKRVAIYRAADLKLMSEIVLPDVEGKCRSDANEMYLSGDRLTVVSSLRENDDEEGENAVFDYYKPAYFRMGKAETECLVYDINNRESPKLIFSHTQSGDYNTSRLIGDTVYTVTRYTVLNYIDAWAFSENDSDASQTDKSYVEKCIPEVNGKKISRSNIDFFKDSDATGYVVVSSFNITKDKSEGASYAYLGDAEDVYCTKDTLYLASELYTECLTQKENKNWKNKWSFKEDGTYTHIFAVAFSENEIKLLKEGYVRGEFINQFAMDEYNGFFRCATTYRDKNWNAISSVIILDKDFKEVSRIDDLAENEEIKSVRFMGDTAYVVTFRNTDPLFVLDLSDPTQPKKAGKVKLPGFSSYLHPIGSDYIVGVGYGGTSTGTDDSVQITLFDISDKKAPKVSASYKIKNVNTEINNSAYDNNSFKAFMWYPEKNIIGIPIERWGSTELIREYVLFKTENGRLELINQYRHENVNYENDSDDIVIIDNTRETEESYEYFPEFFRGTYIENTLYTVSDKTICAFDIESANRIYRVELEK